MYSIRGSNSNLFPGKDPARILDRGSSRVLFDREGDRGVPEIVPREHDWNKDRKLFSHIWDDSLNGFARKAFWGVGNGWAAAGMTRVLRALPQNMSAEKRKIEGYIKEVIDGCLGYLRPDGLYHDVVDDPKSFVETNLSQIMAYSIYRGIKGGWIDVSYWPGADKMREAARAKVDRMGFVQDVCGSPTFEAPGTATEGQAFFILMEAAYRDLNK